MARIYKLLHKSQKTSDNEIFLDNNGKIITNQKFVVNNFNRFYTTVAQKLVEKIDKVNNKFQDYLKNPNKHSIFLNETDPGEVSDILNKLDIKKASDIYGISPKLIKSASLPLSFLLAQVFNRSFQLGQFPDNLKVAKVKPFHKGDSKLIVSNYRPISLLPIISKVFEKIMYKRLMEFLKSENILYKQQFGFQKAKSTEEAIIDIQAKIVEALERKEHPCCIFLDFAKAFDTVNHSILINKLNHYEIRGNTLDWLKTYLTNRKQCVEIGNYKSNLETITYGVPQASVLGPLLFLIYINDIPKSSTVLNFHLFADDTSIFYSHKNLEQLEFILNTELNHVSNWLKANKLSLNVAKSNLLLFRGRNSTQANDIQVSINYEVIEMKKYAKYLGVYMDSKLTWEYHIDHIKTKLVKGNAIIARLRHFVPEKVIRNLYNSYIQPHLDYGALAWGGCTQMQINKLQPIQNNSIRLMTFASNYTDHVSSSYVKLNLLKIKESVLRRQLLFVHDYLNNRLPINFKDFFVLDKDKFDYNLDDIRPTKIPHKFGDYILTEPKMQPQENPVNGQLFKSDYETAIGRESTKYTCILNWNTSNRLNCLNNTNLMTMTRTHLRKHITDYLIECYSKFV